MKAYLTNLKESYNLIECFFAFMHENCQFVLSFTRKPTIQQYY